MRRFAVALIVTFCCAPPASAAGPRARDFEVPLASGATARAAGGEWTKTVRPGRRFDLFGLRWRRAPEHVDVHARVHDQRRGWLRWVELGHAHSARGSDPAWAGGA